MVPLNVIDIPQKKRYSHNIAIAASTPDFAAALADAKA
jgi:sulfate adenylyltransferase subunit 1 (EFTu-like GTPase family)